MKKEESKEISPTERKKFWNSKYLLVLVILIGLFFIGKIIAAPLINFVYPTPDNDTNITNTSVEINITITEFNLEEIIFNWNGTNYTFYNDSLVLMMNFNNVSALGENDTYVIDVSGKGNNGTAIGNPVMNISGGKYGGAFEFDGANDYIEVEVGNSVLTDFVDAFTVEAWVKPSAITTEHGLVYFDENLALFRMTYYTTNKSYVYVRRTDDSWMACNCLANGGVQVDNWYHYVTVFDGQTHLYVNGKLCCESSTTGTMKTPTGSKIWIGRTGYLNGTIDEVRIWNRSLSADEVKQHYYGNLKKYDTDKWNLYINQSNLTDGTYTYYSSAKNETGDINNTEMRILNVDRTPPTIINLSSNVINETKVEITWQTNENANSTLNYGTTIALGDYESNSSFDTIFNYSLTELIPNTTYYYNVTGCDISSYCNTTGPNTFITDATNPIITFITPTPSNDSTINVNYLTIKVSINENASSSLLSWYPVSRFENLEKYSGNPLTIPLYGANGVVHPDVIYFPSGQDGYKYWMVYTPFPPTSAENPNIARSNDGINWVDTGITNPVINTSEMDSDPDFIYISEYSKWFMVWSPYNPAPKKAEITFAYSSNGINWTEYDGTAINGNTNPVILSGTDNNGKAWERNDSVSKLQYPSLLYENGIFYLYYGTISERGNRGGIGLATFTWNNISDNIENFQRNTNNPIINLPENNEFKSGAGHIDISSHDGTYYMYVLREILASLNYELVLLTSTNKISGWANKGKVLSRGDSGSWDERHIYRGSLVTNGTGEVVLFSDNAKLYYSGYLISSIPQIGLATGKSTKNYTMTVNNASENTYAYYTITGLLDGSYTYQVFAFDIAGNENHTETRTIKVEISDVCGNDILENGEECDDGNLVNGDGCSNSCEIESGSFPIFTPTQEQLEKGYAKSLYKNWKIEFKFENKTHTIKLDDIINKTAIITISSEPQTFNLTINQTKKLNLNGNGFYDLEIFLEDITASKADLVVKFVHEEIPGRVTKKKGYEKLSWWLALALIISLIIVILIIAIIKIRKRTKKFNSENI